MLTILGSKPAGSAYCDGISRRNFLRVGALGLGGLALPGVLQAESSVGIRSAGNGHKAVIMIFLPGGPSHQDMFDLKLDAPSEVRGEFKPIPTNVPGIQICEHLPRLARLADKYTVIRSVVGMEDRHESFQCYTGRLNRNQPPGGWPSMGSLLTRVQGAGDPSLPAFVGLAPKMGHVPWSDNGVAGFLGPACAPFEINKGGGKDDMVLNGITLDRLSDRRSLLTALDTFRREVDVGGQIAGLDAYTQQAFGILTSSRMVEALDFRREDPRVIERYGKGDPKNRDDGAPKLMEHFLVARRLVEAGVRCVTLAFSRWDHHGDIRGNLPKLCQQTDQPVAGLLKDLKQRGLLDETLVVALGEFGRSPEKGVSTSGNGNSADGRDHWPYCYTAVIGGAGIKRGYVHGKSDKTGSAPTEDAVHPMELLATIYHSVGIDPETIVYNHLNQPRELVKAKPVTKLFA